MHRDEVLEALWPEQDPDVAGPNLRVVLHAARRALTMPGVRDNRFLHMRDEQLFLAIDTATWIDVEAFEAQAAIAMRSRQVGDLAASLDLYGGELLPEDRYEDWTTGRRERLRESYLEILIELAAVHEREQHYPAAIDLLRRAILIEPSREAGHVALMRIYWNLGQRQLALRHYGELTRALNTELDVEPEPATQELYAAIMAGDRPIRKAATDDAGEPSQTAHWPA
jgi:DNA-binding SARP family transcriptional activator